MKKTIELLLTIGIVCSLALASCAGAATFNQVLDRWSKSVKYIDREDDISNLEIEATYYSAEFIEAYIQREAENNLWTKQEADDYKYKFLQALRLDTSLVSVAVDDVVVAHPYQPCSAGFSIDYAPTCKV